MPVKIDVKNCSSELQLLMTCLSMSQLPEQDRCVHQLSATVENWQYFISLANRHKVLPFVYQQILKKGTKDIPPQVLTALNQRAMRQTAKMLNMSYELARLSEIFNTKKIQMVALKGPALSRQIYENETTRPAGDLDLLVRPEDVVNAEKILRSSGYYRVQPDIDVSNGQYRLYMRILHHFIYRNPETGVTVELHWRYFLDIQLSDVIMPDWRNDLPAIDIHGKGVNTLPVGDNFLYLCVHGAKHKWHRLQWLHDISILASRSHRIDWDFLVAHAKKQGIIRPMLQGMMLAHILLDAPLPEPVHAQIESVKVLPFLISQAFNSISDTGHQKDRRPYAEYFSSRIHHLLLFDTLTRKYHYILERFMPRDIDIMLFHLPDSLYPLYYILSPLHWLYRVAFKKIKLTVL